MCWNIPQTLLKHIHLILLSFFSRWLFFFYLFISVFIYLCISCYLRLGVDTKLEVWTHLHSLFLSLLIPTQSKHLPS